MSTNSKSEEKSNEPFQVKVVVVGEVGVGKTSIVSRAVNPDEKLKENAPSTSAAEYKNMTQKFKRFDKDISFDIWDTAGQEQYRALTKMFYKDARVCILVFDITEKKTYNELKNYWYNQIKESGDKNILFVIAANKIDGNDGPKDKEFYEGEIEKFAEEINAIYCETSAINNTGIKEMFDQIGKRVLEEGGLKRKKVAVTLISLDEEPKKKKKCFCSGKN